MRAALAGRLGRSVGTGAGSRCRARSTSSGWVLAATDPAVGADRLPATDLRRRPRGDARSAADRSSARRGLTGDSARTRDPPAGRSRGCGVRVDPDGARSDDDQVIVGVDMACDGVDEPGQVLQAIGLACVVRRSAAMADGGVVADVAGRPVVRRDVGADFARKISPACQRDTIALRASTHTSVQSRGRHRPPAGPHHASQSCPHLGFGSRQHQRSRYRPAPAHQPFDASVAGRTARRAPPARAVRPARSAGTDGSGGRSRAGGHSGRGASWRPRIAAEVGLTVTISTRELPNRLIVSIRARIAPSETPDFIGRSFGDLYGHLGLLGVTPGAEPLVVYHAFGPEVIDVEVCVPTGRRSARLAGSRPAS